MRKECIETGKTVDAAIESACVKLGCERDVCEFEIIDLPKKTFLGLKIIPAKVKVFIEVPDEEKPRPKAVPPQREAPRQEQNKAQAPMGDVPREAAPREAAPMAAQPPRQQTPRPERPQSAPRRRFEEDDDAPKILVTEGFTEKEILAMGYIDGILRDFGIEAKLVLCREGSGININITGEGLGSIIGRRGETLDAIQYLSGLVANRLEGDYLRITVDCGDYRTKRRDTLEALAQKLAAQVLKTNTSKTLEPMNPFERRVIHATVSKIEGVSSSSIGEEPNRRVVITSPTARRSAPPRPGSYRGRDGERSDHERSGDRDRRPRSGGSSYRDRGERTDRGDRRPGPAHPPRPETTAPATKGSPKETPEATVGGELYGKVDLD